MPKEVQLLELNFFWPSNFKQTRKTFMNVIRIFILSLLSMNLVFSSAQAHQRSWPGKKLSETLPAGKNFVQKQVTLNAAQIKWVENGLGEKIQTEDSTPSFYSTNLAVGQASSWVVFLDATGANGKIEIGLALDPTGKIINVALLDGSESKDVQAPTFLKQFVGKTGTEKFKVGEDIRSPAGQNGAAQAIATGVRRGLLLAMAALSVGAPK
jgi:hypothetical protein